MAWLIDTGVLLRLSNRSDPAHDSIRLAFRILRQSGETLAIASQNLIEFWNVSTRPASARGGYGLSILETDRNVRLLERVFHLLPDGPGVHLEWRRLVLLHNVKGVQVHDARLAAVMLVHGISNILTLNPDDFRRYGLFKTAAPHEICG